MTPRNPTGPRKSKRLVFKKETLRDLSLRDPTPVKGGAAPRAAVFETRAKTCTCDGC
jgi:hypothetical protein